VITAGGRPSQGAFSVADPRAAPDAAQYQQYGVLRMEDPAGAVIGVKSPGQGTFSVADPRHHGPAKHNDQYRIVPWERHAGTVTSAGGKAACVQDPRPTGPLFGKYACADWAGAAGTVIARSDSGQGAFGVADPRPANQRQQGDAYLTNGHYGVVPWDGASGAVSAAAGHDNGRWSVADPRLPDARENLVCVIRALDNTWHRPFTTLELAALQSLVDPEEKLELDGLSDQAWRERIGNAVPPAAARAIAEEIGRTLLLAWTGQTFALGATPIWVRDVAVALTLPGARA
jgi:site-specific DNA-cytosine methylase